MRPPTRPRRIRAPLRGTSGMPSSQWTAVPAFPTGPLRQKPRRPRDTSRPDCRRAVLGRDWTRQQDGWTLLLPRGWPQIGHYDAVWKLTMIRHALTTGRNHADIPRDRSDHFFAGTPQGPLVRIDVCDRFFAGLVAG